MKKRYLLTAAAVAATLMLTACGNKDKNNNESTTETTTQQTETTTENNSTEAGTDNENVKTDADQMLQNVHQAVQEVFAAFYPSGMQMQDDATFMQETLKLDAAWYDSAIVEVPMLSMSVDTFAVVHATEGNLDNVVNAFNAYKDYLINDSFQYPMNMPKIQAATVGSTGEYAYFIILSGMANVDDMEENVENQIKAYEESNKIAIDTISGVINGEIVVTPWSELQKVHMAIKKAYGNTYLPSMQCQDDESFMKDVLKLDASWYDDVIVEVPMISAHADMLVLVDASEGNVENVTNALNAYKEYLVNESLQYPMNEARVKSAVVQAVGDYVCFSILGGVVDNPEDMGLNTDEDIADYYLNMNMNAIYAIMQHTGIYE